MDLNIEKFQKWLEQGGCDILPPTNEYEALKFKGRIIGIVYKSGKTSNKYTARAIKFFKENKKWDGYPPNVGRKSNYKKEKIQVLERDGDQCFFCNKKLGDDITLEHLLALSRGGRNDLSKFIHMCKDQGFEIVNQGGGKMPNFSGYYATLRGNSWGDNPYKVKADKWDKLDEKIAKFYPERPIDDTEEDEYDEGLIGIGEAAASAFGYL